MKLKINRFLLAYLADVVAAGLSVQFALFVRFGESVGERPLEFVAAISALMAASAAVAFAATRMYRISWRYVSIDDLLAIVKGVSFAILIFLPLSFFLFRLEQFPRSIVIIVWGVQIMLIAGSRTTYRMFREGRLSLARRAGRDATPILLVGNADGADLFLRNLLRQAEPEFNVLGIVSTSPVHQKGQTIHGVSVCGSASDLDAILRRMVEQGHPPQKLVITDEWPSAEYLRELLDVGGRFRIQLARMPRLTELKSGDGSEPSNVKSIELADLLTRHQTKLDPAPLISVIRGQRVVVTGAGGSIGSELVRQICALGPSTVCMIDSSEFGLYAIDLEMGEKFPDIEFRPRLCDVRHRENLRRILADERPAIVFHAAACKHVPLVELNPLEGAWTNSVGTRHLADICLELGIQAMVMISTDKAVNPSSVMGATKRLAESYCQALDIRSLREGLYTRFVTVRFGNVLGSTGSVVPLFQRQIAAGGPLTVTHQDVTRYFMTISEAVQLTLHASAYGVSHRDLAGRIFVLDMGKPVRVVDLARQMIRLAGFRPDLDIAIRFTGLRPGEKLSEEVFHDAEPATPTGVPSVLTAAPRMADYRQLTTGMDALEAACRAGDVGRSVEIVRDMVPEFRVSMSRIPAPQDFPTSHTSPEPQADGSVTLLPGILRVDRAAI